MQTERLAHSCDPLVEGGSPWAPGNTNSKLSTSSATSSNSFITVFGFSPSSEHYVLAEFEKFGRIAQLNMMGDANYMHICYEDVAHARKALEKDGKLLRTKLMIGVKPFVEEEVLHEQLSDRLEAELVTDGCKQQAESNEHFHMAEGWRRVTVKEEEESEDDMSSYYVSSESDLSEPEDSNTYSTCMAECHPAGQIEDEGSDEEMDELLTVTAAPTENGSAAWKLRESSRKSNKTVLQKAMERRELENDFACEETAKKKAGEAKWQEKNNLVETKSSDSKQASEEGSCGQHKKKQVRHQCQVCDYSTNYKSHLTQHMSTHSEEKPFVCSVCNKRFTRKGHLSRHKRTHSSDKQFSCGNCGWRFCRKDALDRHMRIHTG